MLGSQVARGSSDSGSEALTSSASPFKTWPVDSVAPRIVASAAPPITTYTLSPEVPSATHYAWSGADYGSVTGSTTNTVVWNHREDGCEHAGEAHPDTQITVLISAESFELRCKYRSAASGKGEDYEVEK